MKHPAKSKLVLFGLGVAIIPLLQWAETLSGLPEWSYTAIGVAVVVLRFVTKEAVSTKAPLRRKP